MRRKSVFTESEKKAKYLERKGIKLAYQVFGNQPRDLIIVPGVVSNVEFFHEMRGYSQFIKTLTQHFRVITFDKRGNGLSQRSVEELTPETRIDDIKYVMDEVGSKKATIFGFSEGAALSSLFTALHPERVKKLILFGGMARIAGPKWMPGPIFKFISKLGMNSVVKNWGNGEFFLKTFSSKVIVDNKIRKLAKDFEASSCTKHEFNKLVSLIHQLDIRPFLKDVQCPTLIMHSEDDRLVPIESANDFVQNIQNVDFVKLKEAGHIFWAGESDYILEKVIDFSLDDEELENEGATQRSLATIMFNDIVNSTNLQRELGDTAWKEKIQSFIEILEKNIFECEGTLIKTMGDGALAIFDGPTKAIKCSFGIKNDVKKLGLSIRAGLHIGEIEKLEGDISGLNVNLASRIQSVASGGQILVSDILTSLVLGSGVTFEEFGEVNLKGFEGSYKLKEVTSISKFAL